MTILQIKSFPIKIILFFFLVIGAFAVLTLIPITKYRIFNVQTGSMQPTINTGSMIVVKAVSEYRVNDIITFINPNYSK